MRHVLQVVIDHGRLVAGTQDGRLVLNMVLLLRFAAQLASLVAAVHALGMIFGYISSRSLGLNVEGSQSDHDIEDASLWVKMASLVRILVPSSEHLRLNCSLRLMSFLCYSPDHCKVDILLAGAKS